MNAILEKIRGLRSCLAFTNAPVLLVNRMFFRNLATTYWWKGRWQITCNPATCDHYSVQELLCDGIYNDLLDRIDFRSPITYLNIGAHIGVFDIVIAEKFGADSRGLAAELNPDTFVRLSFVLKLNALQNVTPVPCGVAAHSGIVSIVEGTSSRGDSFGPPSEATSNSKVAEVTTMDKLTSTYLPDSSFIDLLKLDCEGAEYEILDSVGRDILSKFRWILLEQHPPLNPGMWDDIEVSLARKGFELFDHAAGRPEIQLWKNVLNS